MIPPSVTGVKGLVHFRHPERQAGAPESLAANQTTPYPGVRRGVGRQEAISVDPRGTMDCTPILLEVHRHLRPHSFWLWLQAMSTYETQRSWKGP